MKQEGNAEEEDPFFFPQLLLGCSRSERWVQRRFPSPPVVRWRPAGTVIEAEWTAADGQERGGFMKRARRMALAPAGEQSAGSYDECVCVLVCGRACELNLISSACWTMRGNILRSERKPVVIVLTVFGIVSVSRRKIGHLQGATHTEVRIEEKERSWCPPEWSTSPTSPPPLIRKRKVSLIWAAAQHIRLQLPAPFDEAGPGQEHRWRQGRAKTSFFMVEGLLSIWARPSSRGLHLGAKCLVCVNLFPAADRQEDTSAKAQARFVPAYRMKHTPKVILRRQKEKKTLWAEDWRKLTRNVHLDIHLNFWFSIFYCHSLTIRCKE